MKRLVTLTLGLLLIAAQFVAAPAARAADIGRIVAALADQMPSGEIQRRSAFCIPVSLPLPGPYGGTLTLAGEMCPSASGMSATVVGTYADYGVAPGITINGSCNASVTVVMDMATQTASGVNVVMSGGPVTYTINGQDYAITFNDFTVAYGAGSMTPVSASGGLTVNGVYYPATVALAEYII